MNYPQEDRRHPSSEELLAHVDKIFESHVTEEIARYDETNRRIEKIEESLEELLNIVKGAKWVGGFIRWAVAVGAVVGTGILWVKDHITFR